ncbi:hypothetical protein, partial [Vibrio parahaemolyticus]|uniref:hypothetical protein n=1 Tax=Vibrio parahaemolyticus TaxID=670 RepID=UPI001BAFD2AF
LSNLYDAAHLWCTHDEYQQVPSLLLHSFLSIVLPILRKYKDIIVLVIVAAHSITVRHLIP